MVCAVRQAELEATTALAASAQQELERKKEALRALQDHNR